MLDYEYLKITDKEWVDELLSYSQFKNCDYCFGNIFLWGDIYSYKAARYKDFLILKSDNEKYTHFSFPAGRGDLKEIIDLFIDTAHSEKKPLLVSALTEERAEVFNDLYGDNFEVRANRDYSDYIYLRDNLANLPGKKYHSKRNHISYFEKNNDWQFEPIDNANISDCADMLDKWLSLSEKGDDLSDEKRCILNAFEHYEELGLDGGLIRTQDGVVAFTMGERLNDNTFCTHFEKAYSSIRGAYPIINREFARYLSDYKYINREEDLGDEGLRKSKLTYHPDILLNKYSAFFNI